MAELTLVSALSFDPDVIRTDHVREGRTIAELVAIAMPGATLDMLDRAHVVLVRDGQTAEISSRIWHRMRPKAGTEVRVQAVVGNGALKSIASIAILAAAAFLAPYAIGLVGLAGVQGAAAIATGVITAAGQLLLNSLVPVKGSDDDSQKRYSISGTRNQANPWGPVPVVLGKNRVYPPYAALPYTSIVGNDQYLHCLFAIGYGLLQLSDWRIGDTALGDFADVQIEIRAGWPTDTRVTLYEETVFEDGLNIELQQADGFSIRRSASNVESLSVDIYFPNGLFWVDSNQETREIQVALEVQYRLRGSSYWTYVTAIFVSEAERNPFWRSFRGAVGFGVGTYEVQIKRVNADSTDSNTTDTVVWSVLRSIRHEYPIRNFPKPLALVALKIRANKQLNGTTDQFNLLAESIVPDWDAGSASWVTRANKNASLYRYVLTGGPNALARTADQCDNDTLADWHNWGSGKQLSYNRYHDFDASARDVAAAVAAAGRASPSQRNGRWGVVIDRPQSVVRAHIAARNASNLSGEVIYRKLPDAWRIKFLDEDDDYKETELIVPRPGLVGDPVLFEELGVTGYTSRALNWREGRRRFAELMQRYEEFTATQDIQHLLAPRGSLVQFQMPVLSDQMVSARVKEVASVTLSGAPATLVLLDDQVTMVEGAAYACRFRRADGTTSLWSIATVPGTTRTLRLVAGGSLPAAGDLAAFGLAGYESIDCVVKSIEPMKDFSARLKLVRHAPEIEAIADSGAVPPVEVVPTVPAWSTRAPAAPIIVDALSGSDAVILGEVGSPVVVHVRPDAGTVPVDHFVVSARRGAESAITLSVPGSTGRAVFDSFAVGDTIAITATAVSAYGVSSPVSAALSHTVQKRSDVPADLAAVSVSTFSSGLRRFDWSFDPAASADQTERITGYRIRTRPGSGWTWAEMATGPDLAVSAQPFDTTLPLTAGPHTVGIVAVDRFGQFSLTPAIAEVTLGMSSAMVVTARIESNEAFDGTLDDGTVAADGLEGTGTPSLTTYTLPDIDLGGDMPVEVRSTPYGAAGTVTIRMVTGLTADGEPTGTVRALGIVTARYVRISLTITNPDALARLGDLVTIITPA